MKTLISFRLRKDIDSDLIELLKRIDSKMLPDMCRSGLRLMLGMKTTKAVHIIERPIIPEITDHVNTTNETTQTFQLQAKGTLWKPPSK